MGVLSSSLPRWSQSPCWIRSMIMVLCTLAANSKCRTNPTFAFAWQQRRYLHRRPVLSLPYGIDNNNNNMNPGRSTSSTVLYMSNVNDGDNNDIGESSSVQAIQQRLVKLGLEWKQASISEHHLTRVPGCVASVYIRASLNRKDDADDDHDNNNSSPLVTILGNSDAILSRGILAMLCEYLQSLSSVQEILDLDPNTIADELRIRSALSKGRNDGMANMLRIVQDQLSVSPPPQQQPQDDEDTADSVVAQTTTTTINQNTGPTVALLLSGGVDSSVALRLLQQEGYQVTAYYLKIWLEDEMAHLNECPWEDDIQMCHEVCNQAGVPLEIVSLQEEYHQRVMQHTLKEASMGRTPNPDILCNSRIKFGCFLEYLKKKKEDGAVDSKTDDDDNEYRYDYIASGHYAQLDRQDDSSIVRLRRAPDPVKDQSYFLCALTQNQLSKLLFPIGHLEKSQVRQLANDFELPNRNRPDSQGLCFLGKVKFRDFLEIHLGCRPGDIVDAYSGDQLGRHDGVWYHTVGQRKGIGKSLFPLATARGPWYVVAKDPAQNIVYASNLYDQEVFAQARSEFHVENIHWIAGGPPVELVDMASSDVDNDNEESLSFRLGMKIRHGPRIVQGTIHLLQPNDDDAVIRLDAKDGGLAPGQYVVFYKPNDDECLGGGIISERHWARFLLDNASRRKDDVAQQAEEAKVSTTSGR